MVQRTGSVVGPLVVPVFPSLQGLFHKGHVELIGAVFHADDFGDIGAGCIRMGDGAGIDQGHPVAAPLHFECSGGAIDAGANYQGGGV